MRELAVHYMQVGPTDSACLDIHQHLARTWLRFRNVAQLERGAGMGENHRAHCQNSVLCRAVTGREEAAAIDLSIDITSSREACPGVVASYLLRTIALQAGCFAPGIQEAMFYELHGTRFGASIEGVEGWMYKATGDLQRLGYRLGGRRVAFRTDAILTWILAGRGYRAALLSTNARTLYPAIKPDDLRSNSSHAVALKSPPEGGSKPQLVMVDPLPKMGSPRPPPQTLEDAHRAAKLGTFVFYWSGWS
jgi:hypothetical protein